MQIKNIWLFLFFSYLVSPKVSILAINSFNVRIEDVISIVMLLVIVLYRMFFLSKELRLYYIFVLFCFVSIFLNGDPTSVLQYMFIIKAFIYHLWFFVGYKIARYIDYDNLLRYFTLTLTILVIWGGLELIGILPKIGYFSGDISRLSGNTSGPYEFAALLGMLIILAKSGFVRNMALVPFWYTQSRISIIALFAIVAIGIKREYFIYLILVAIGVFLLVFNNIIETRFSSLASFKDLYSTILNHYSSSYIVLSSDAYIEATHGKELWQNLSGDIGASMEIRLYRWAYIFKYIFSSFSTFVMGFGPGFFGFAVDNNYIRIFGESGFLGLLLFMFIMIRMLIIVKYYPKFYWAFIYIFFSSIFIDLFTASKIMPIIWFLYGFSLAKQFNFR